MSFTKKIVTTYAKSIFQSIKNFKPSKTYNDSFDISNITSAETKNFLPTVSTVNEELLLLRAVIISSKTLNKFFNNPTCSEKQKLEVLLSIFPGLSKINKSFLKILTERSHLNLIPEISDEYSKFLLQFKNITKVKLITASILQENSGLLLLDTLKKLTNSSEIILNVSYAPRLLGGFILEYNSTSVDASVLKEFSLFFNNV